MRVLLRSKPTSLNMQGILATVLVVVSVVAAEPPRFRTFSRQTSSGNEPEANGAPYPASGWRPEGAAFTLPQKQQDSRPPASYVPPQKYGPPKEETTTEMPMSTEAETEQTTDEPQSENIRDTQANKENLNQQPAPGAYYILLPQKQNYAYAIQTQSAPLVALPQANILAAAPARLQTVQVAPLSSAVTTSIYTPFSSSFLQIIQ